MSTVAKLQGVTEAAEITDASKFLKNKITPRNAEYTASVWKFLAHGIKLGKID